MAERDFVFWLRGFFEMTNPEVIPAEQVKMIKEHLDKVFVAQSLVMGPEPLGSDIKDWSWATSRTKDPLIC